MLIIIVLISSPLLFDVGRYRMSATSMPSVDTIVIRKIVDATVDASPTLPDCMVLAATIQKRIPKSDDNTVVSIMATELR